MFLCFFYLGPVCLFCVFGVFSSVYSVLSVPVQVIAWNDSFLKCVEQDVKLYSLFSSN